MIMEVMSTKIRHVSRNKNVVLEFGPLRVSTAGGGLYPVAVPIRNFETLKIFVF